MKVEQRVQLNAAEFLIGFYNKTQVFINENNKNFNSN